MHVDWFRSLPALVLFALLAPVFPADAVAATAAVEPGPPAKPPATYPQIVRISYVEGDVRVSRGKQAVKADGKEPGDATGWEKTPVGLPLETGFSLVTGQGRAEIEFEDASTVYLADNSVLTFNELSSTGGAPHTAIALLSGAASLNVQNMMPGEWFLLTTPADNLSMRYPQHAFLRVNSYMDAIAITPQRELTFSVPGVAANRATTLRQTITLHNGHRVYAAQPDVAESADWDRWVETRVAARENAMTAAMKASGLSAPIPGLAEMNGQGHFFPCEPYGTCWEPAEGWDGHASLAAQNQTQAANAVPSQGQTTTEAYGTPDRGGPAQAAEEDISRQVELVDPPQQPSVIAATYQYQAQPQTAAQAWLSSHPGATLRTEDEFFPCMPEAFRYLIARDPITGEERVIDSGAYLYGFPSRGGFLRAGGYGPFGLSPYMNGNPWEWAVCHTGAWIHREHRYVWVAGLKRHHHRPVHWVQSGHLVGFVPIHPRDVAGKPPLNLKNGLYTAKGDKGAALALIGLDLNKPVKLLDEPPKEFRKPVIAPLERAEIPRPEAHAVTNLLFAGKVAFRDQPVSHDQAVPITFDRKTQTFMVVERANDGDRGDRGKTVLQPFGGGGGNMQNRGGEVSSMMRSANNAGEQNRGSNSGGNAGGSYSHASAPAPSYSAGGGYGGGAAAHSSAPSAPSAQSAPSAPSGGGGGSSSSGGGAARTH